MCYNNNLYNYNQPTEIELKNRKSFILFDSVAFENF